jgi:hypothetical protein
LQAHAAEKRHGEQCISAVQRTQFYDPELLIGVDCISLQE